MGIAGADVRRERESGGKWMGRARGWTPFVRGIVNGDWKRERELVR